MMGGGANDDASQLQETHIPEIAAATEGQISDSPDVESTATQGQISDSPAELLVV